MDFALSEEQVLLEQTARSFFAERLPVPRLRRGLAWQDSLVRGLWAEMAGLGWTGVALPEASGGVGLGALEAMLLARAAGAGLCPLPLVSTLAVSGLVRAEPALAPEAAALAAGRLAVSLALDDAAPLRHAGQCDEHWTLGRGAQGLRLTRQRDGGLASRAGLDPLIPVASRDGAPRGDARACALAPGQAADAERFAVLCFMAEMAGAAQGALDLAVRYAGERHQFGRPVGSFQAVKHRLADAWVALDNAWNACLAAAATLDEGMPGGAPGEGAGGDVESLEAERAEACAVAHALTAEAAREAAASAIQAHGGLGFTWECDAQLHYKRVLSLLACLPPAERAWQQVEAAMLDEALPG